MTFIKNALVTGMTTALVLSLSATAWAKKCKDGETTEVASFTVEKGKTLGAAINKSLTGKAGDPKNGLKTMVHRRQGNCIACHKVTKIRELAKPGDLKAFKKYGFQGEVGPSLDGLADRYTEGEIRMMVVDPKANFPETLMPSFHKLGKVRVHKDCVGKVVMTAQKVEDVVAYLMTLKK